MAKLLSWDNPQPQIEHLLDYFNQGTKDSVWIPKIANEGWVVLTADRGKKSARNKLPVICKTYKVTHILVGPSLVHVKQAERCQAVVSVWEKIKCCNNAPKGTRFLLSKSPKGVVTLRRLS